MPDKAVVEFTLTEDDLVTFTDYTLAKSRFHRRSRLLSFLVPALSVMIGAAGIMIVDALRDDDFADIVGIDGVLHILAAAAAVGGLMWALRPLRVRRGAQRRYRDGTFASSMEPARVELTLEGINYTGGKGSGLMLWPMIVDVATGPQALYAYTTSLQAVIIPRRAFSDVAAFDRFAAVLREHREASGATSAG